MWEFISCINLYLTRLPDFLPRQIIYGDARYGFLFLQSISLQKIFKVFVQVHNLSFNEAQIISYVTVYNFCTFKEVEHKFRVADEK